MEEPYTDVMMEVPVGQTAASAKLERDGEPLDSAAAGDRAPMKVSVVLGTVPAREPGERVGWQ